MFFFVGRVVIVCAHGVLKKFGKSGCSQVQTRQRQIIAGPSGVPLWRPVGKRRLVESSAHASRHVPAPTHPWLLSGAPPNQFSVAAVAQWIEYWPPKPRVVGSIPASRTKLTFAILRGGLFVWGKALSTKDFCNLLNREHSPSSADTRGLKRVCLGFFHKSGLNETL